MFKFGQAEHYYYYCNAELHFSELWLIVSSTLQFDPIIVVEFENRQTEI